MTVYEKVAHGRLEILDYSQHLGKVVEYESDRVSKIKERVSSVLYVSKLVASVILSMSISFYIMFVR